MIAFNFCFQMDEMQSLSCWDRAVLLRGSFKAFYGLLHAWFTSPIMLPM